MSPAIAAALIGSAPTWAMAALALSAQRRSIDKSVNRALDKQTVDLKAHITSTVPGATAPAADEQKEPS